METSYIHYSPEVLEKVDISLDHDKADQDGLPDEEEMSDVHDSVNVLLERLIKIVLCQPEKIHI